jgi:hypothetical protein
MISIPPPLLIHPTTNSSGVQPGSSNNHTNISERGMHIPPVDGLMPDVGLAGLILKG